MEDELISLECARLAKEKKFILNPNKVQILYFWFCNTLSTGTKGLLNKYLDRSDIYLAPTQSLLQRWLREVHNISISVETSWEGSWDNGAFVFQPVIWKRFNEDYSNGYFNTYEEALEFGLIEGLKLIK